MKPSDELSKKGFLYPKSCYNGAFNLGNFAFNANLQEFAHRITYISNLHTGGKLSSKQAYRQIKELWQKLERNHEEISTPKDF